ncbi:hypothetical protein NHP194004_15620 [Helicobacter suis]|nr:hypothetical protein NHP194004_15620 [Helicobacter suis]
MPKFFECHFTKSKHKKEDRYHKITSGLSNKFELVAVENLQVRIWPRELNLGM